MRHRELNDPREMIRRLMYSGFLVSSIAGFWMLVSVVVDWSIKRMVGTIGAASLACLFHYIGNRFFSFKGIHRTFVFSGVPPRLDPRLHELYREVEQILQTMQTPDLEPMERQAQRNRLTRIVRDEPEIFGFLEDEILAVYPSIRRPGM